MLDQTNREPQGMTDQFLDQPAIKAEGLTKTYRASAGAKPVTALNHVDLEIPRGSIFGLLGPNGAGKSTFINILAGLVIKTSGTANIWGFDIDENPRNAKASIGVVPQEIYFDPFFTPREMLELQAGMYGVAPKDRKTEEILKALSLYDKADAYSRSLSGGMKRRLLVGKAMVHNPPILILDEPTAGVDIELRRGLWAYVRELNERGVTIVLTTHYLEEAEELCSHIAIINKGEVAVCTTKDELMSRIDEKELVLTVDEPIMEVPDSLKELGARLLDSYRLAFHYKRDQVNSGQIISRTSAAGFTILDVTSKEAALEEIFLKLTSSAKD
jgi:ABC-2 type transport system ATP-binding protein